MIPLPLIDPPLEVARTREFIRKTLTHAHHEKVIIAISGGLDSATSLYLLTEVMDTKNLFVVHLPYYDSSIAMFEKTIAPLALPKENILLYPITNTVNRLAKNLKTGNDSLRLGNIMARIRMIHLFDLAKKHHALVCGTENRSEYHLGYFTRFGDAASDFEIINHLYKTQVRTLASYLKVPNAVLTAAPSADLWPGQTDEKEMGFLYEQADPVLYLYFDKRESLQQITNDGYTHAAEIISIAEKNRFKHEVPYTRASF